MKHLRQERKLSVEKISLGVYHINKEIFGTQIIVTNRLPPEENLYLHFLTNRIWNGASAERLADDYKAHQEQDVYDRYMHQLAAANKKSEGEVHMVINEWLYEMCGTSSDEVIARAKKESEEYYQPKIDYLKSLLIQNNIPFSLEMEGDAD